MFILYSHTIWIEHEREEALRDQEMIENEHFIVHYLDLFAGNKLIPYTIWDGKLIPGHKVTVWIASCLTISPLSTSPRSGLSRAEWDEAQRVAYTTSEAPLGCHLTGEWETGT